MMAAEGTALLSRQPKRFIGNFVVIWFDMDTSKMDNAIHQLQRSVNSVRIFDDFDQCVNFIIDTNDQKICLVMSGSVNRNFISLIHDIPQLDSVYIFQENDREHEYWIKEWKKIRDIYIDISSICDHLKRKNQQWERHLAPISFATISSSVDLNELDQSFMYSQLLKDILLTMEPDTKAKENFFHFCRLQQSSNNDFELNLIDEVERDFDYHSPIWWYTKESFLYSTLNRALRIQDIEIIIKMGFFIRDLHQQIEQLHLETHPTTTMIIYRGQGVSNVDFEKMKKNQGALLSFNNFLSTSVDQQVSVAFASSARDDPDLVGILFHIEIDPSISSVPFTSLDKISYYSDSEQEILFSMHTIFRIGEISQIENRLWDVHLKLTSDNDEQLKHLTEYIRNEIDAPTGWQRLGRLMVDMGEFDKAKEIMTTLSETNSDDNWNESVFIHHQLGYISHQKGDLSNALFYYNKSLNIALSHLSHDDPELSAIYSNIGSVLRDQKDFNSALEYHQRALTIDLQAPEPNQQEVATKYNNIGEVLADQEKDAEALKSFENALKIELLHLPSRHPLLAITYSNISVIYSRMKNYSNAILYLEKTLEIQEKSLPPNHPSLAVTHGNMVMSLICVGRLKEATEHNQRAVDITRLAFGSDHPQVQHYQKGLDQLRRYLP